MFSKKLTFYIKIIIIYLLLPSSYAQERLLSNPSQVSFLYGVGSTEKIQRILSRVRLIPPVSYFAGIGYRSPLLGSTPIKLEIQTLKHFGRQTAWEVIICPVIETPKVQIRNVGFTWAIGNGISALIGKNAHFEDAKGIKTRRVLNYLLIEQNIFFRESPHYQVTLRWHHRCHVFGKIAPKRTGSNFFVIGIKYLI